MIKYEMETGSCSRGRKCDVIRQPSLKRSNQSEGHILRVKQHSVARVVGYRRSFSEVGASWPWPNQAQLSWPCPPPPAPTVPSSFPAWRIPFEWPAEGYSVCAAELLYHYVSQSRGGEGALETHTPIGDIRRFFLLVSGHQGIRKDKKPICGRVSGLCGWATRFSLLLGD